MHNKVVYHATKVLNAPEWGFGFPVLRFNFRGTGLSEGKYDGKAESADVIAALNWLHAEYSLPVIVTGFSFGAAMALTACCGDAEFNGKVMVQAFAALGLPTHAFERRYEHPSLVSCTLPKLFLSGDRDQFAPKQELEQAVDSASEPKSLVLIPDADHFFTGRLERMQHALAGWLKEQVA